jgi:hypothetical protein
MAKNFFMGITTRSSWASLLEQSAARYEADNATGLVSLSPMQCSSEVPDAVLQRKS